MNSRYGGQNGGLFRPDLTFGVLRPYKEGNWRTEPLETSSSPCKELYRLGCLAVRNQQEPVSGSKFHKEMQKVFLKLGCLYPEEGDSDTVTNQAASWYYQDLEFNRLKYWHQASLEIWLWMEFLKLLEVAPPNAILRWDEMLENLVKQANQFVKPASISDAGIFLPSPSVHPQSVDLADVETRSIGPMGWGLLGNAVLQTTRAIDEGYHPGIINESHTALIRRSVSIGVFLRKFYKQASRRIVFMNNAEFRNEAEISMTGQNALQTKAVCFAGVYAWALFELAKLYGSDALRSCNNPDCSVLFSPSRKRNPSKPAYCSVPCKEVQKKRLQRQKNS